MMALAFSGGKDSMACLHLMKDDLDCAIYVDTGFAYPETQELVGYAATLVPMHIVSSDRKGQNAREGIPADVVPISWTAFGQLVTTTKPWRIQSYLGCCCENISLPLLRAAKDLGVTQLVYGQRNEEGHKATSRNGDVIDGITRLHPIEEWTKAQVLDYLATKMPIPAHYALKHSSLDCYDCTAFEKESSDRITWMQQQHPDLYQSYRTRRVAVDTALKEALLWQVA